MRLRIDHFMKYRSLVKYIDRLLHAGIYCQLSSFLSTWEDIFVEKSSRINSLSMHNHVLYFSSLITNNFLAGYLHRMTAMNISSRMKIMLFCAILYGYGRKWANALLFEIKLAEGPAGCAVKLGLTFSRCNTSRTLENPIGAERQKVTSSWLQVGRIFNSVLLRAYRCLGWRWRIYKVNTACGWKSFEIGIYVGIDHPAKCKQTRPTNMRSVAKGLRIYWDVW